VVLCLFLIDDARSFQERHDAEDRELYRFILCNIAGEVLAERYAVELGTLEEDGAIAILNPNGKTCPPEEIDPLLSRIQHHMLEFFQLSLSVSVSRIGSDFRDVTLLHQEARRFIEYRLFAGRAAVIHPEAYRANEESGDADYPLALDKQLMEAIRKQDLRRIDAALGRIVTDIRTHRVEHAAFFIPRLLGVIRTTIAEMNRDRVQPIIAEYVPLQRLLATIETIDGIQESLSSFLHELLSTKPDRSRDRNRIVSETVLEIVAKNHADPNLSLQQIASLMRMSSDYVGRIFRIDQGFSVAEAINDYRIEKAAEWLRNTDLEVKQIMLRVGIDNESHFYRQFKAHFSVTPREYALHMRRRS
jgi:AraC-like DNA-binding protein